MHEWSKSIDSKPLFRNGLTGDERFEELIKRSDGVTKAIPAFESLHHFGVSVKCTVSGYQDSQAMATHTQPSLSKFFSERTGITSNLEGEDSQYVASEGFLGNCSGDISKTNKSGLVLMEDSSKKIQVGFSLLRHWRSLQFWILLV